MENISIKPDWVFSPQPMYIIGTKNEDGTPNFCVITWIGFSFDKTPHIMMSIGGSKLTKTNILREKKFSAHMITEDTLWLADYFGNTSGEVQAKTRVNYTYKWGELVEVPILEESPWVYECEVDHVWELDGAHLFLAEVKNIQIAKEYEEMDMQKIDLTRLKPAIYAPYQYFSIGEKLGEMGEWEKHLKIKWGKVKDDRCK